MEDQKTPLPQPSPNVIFKPLPEGGVLFSTETEEYFGVNTLGARVWELLPPRMATVEDLCALLTSDYADQPGQRIQEDVRQFLADLITTGLAVHSRNPRAD